MPPALGKLHRDVLGWIALGVAVGAALTWALQVVTRPAAAIPPEPTYLTAEATDGRVERVLRLNATATWTAESSVANRARGVVTRRELIPGAEIKPGSVLYRVDERPVIAAQGSVPAYRDLASGAKGADVAQLEKFLVTQGFARHTVDQSFTAATTASVKAWQRKVGLPPTGVMGVGDLVYFDRLPTRGALDEKAIAKGGTVSGGEAGINVFGSAPHLTIRLDAGQAQVVQPGMGVELTHHGKTWRARVTALQQGPQTEFTDAVLGPVGEGTICGVDCASVPPGATTLIPARIFVVPPVTGVTIPSAAIQSDTSGATFVVDEPGQRRPVTVKAARGGTSVVTGLERGTVVRLPRTP